jgi:hypothetical protein
MPKTGGYRTSEVLRVPSVSDSGIAAIPKLDNIMNRGQLGLAIYVQRTPYLIGPGLPSGSGMKPAQILFIVHDPGSAGLSPTVGLVHL